MDNDLISRKAALSVVGFAMADSPSITREDWNAIFDALEGVPSAQPERKKGKWIYRPEIGWGEAWVCSECEEITKSTIMGKPRYNFCPNCGADMRGDTDE